MSLCALRLLVSLCLHASLGCVSGVEFSHRSSSSAQEQEQVDSPPGAGAGAGAQQEQVDSPPGSAVEDVSAAGVQTAEDVSIALQQQQESRLLKTSSSTPVEDISSAGADVISTQQTPGAELSFTYSAPNTVEYRRPADARTFRTFSDLADSMAVSVPRDGAPPRRRLPGSVPFDSVAWYGLENQFDVVEEVGGLGWRHWLEMKSPVHPGGRAANELGARASDLAWEVVDYVKRNLLAEVVVQEKEVVGLGAARGEAGVGSGGGSACGLFSI